MEQTENTRSPAAPYHESKAKRQCACAEQRRTAKGGSYMVSERFWRRADALSAEKPDPQGALRRYQRIASGLLGAMMVSLLLAASLIRVSGAVIGAGEVAVAGKVKTISHPTGGVIAAILVKEGDRVRAGEALIRFDTEVAGVSASMTRMNLEQLLAQRARLEAERDGRSGPVFPPGLRAPEAMKSERRLFALRREALTGEQAQLAERIDQLQEQIASYEAQIAAYRQQQALIAPERAAVHSLWERKLVTINRLNELERTAVSLEGSVAALQADIAQTRARISEVRQQSTQLVQQRRSEAAALLAETEQQIAEQRQRTANASEGFDRSIIRAPASGTVDQLAYTTRGSFIPPAQPILRIVPDGPLAIEARIAPADREQLQLGQKARITFPSLNRQTTPDLSGTLRFISAERADDPRTGQAFYTARIVISPGASSKAGLELLPGMPAEIYIQTGSRSLLSFLTKPLADQFSRAFREN